MAQHTVHRLACLVALLAATTSQDQTRWSRQISSYTSDISDWVPLPGPVQREPPKQALPPIKRQAVAEPRILSEPFPGFSRPTGFDFKSGLQSQDFPPRNYFNSPANRQLYLQSVPSAPQNYLTDTGFGQSIRFGLSQPNFPLNQGFVSPQFAFDGPPGPPPKPQSRPQLPIAQNPIKFDNFPKIPSNQVKPFVSHIGQAPSLIGQGPSHIAQGPSHIAQGPSHIAQGPSHIAQAPSHIAQAPSFIGQAPSHSNQAQGHLGQAPSHIAPPKPKPDVPKFVDGYKAEKKPVQSLHKIKFDNYDKSPKVETIPSKPKVEREEVQLLYVPVESLNRGQFNFRNPMTSSQLLNTDLYSQSLPKPNPLKTTFLSEPPKSPAKPIDTFSAGQDYYSNYDVLKDDQVPKYSTVASIFPTFSTTTPKPKKLKPHQPPLAIFLTQEARKGHQIKVGDVLSSLKNADTIAVLDTVNPMSAPKVFIGPSSLKPPENYVRFELPYLSNIENSDKKRLPFFVAPLSYNTPQGFAKIPFPSPHVGSVVINSQIKETNPPAPVRHSSPPANINVNAYTVNQPDQKPVTQKPSFTYYSTSAPKTNPPSNNLPQYYSFEPQAVSAIPPAKESQQTILSAPPKTGSYFISNVGEQYNPQYSNFPPPEPVREYNPGNNKRIRPETTTTARTTVTTTTTKPPSTYSSQLLETHNPYSINQAFHFSTPLDYHNYFDDLKDPYATPGFNNGNKVSPTPINPPSSQPPKHEVVTEKQTYHQQQSTPNYLQNYSPEIHYEVEVPNSRYPVYNTNDYSTKPEVSSENYQTVSQPIVETAPPANTQNYHVVSQESVEYTPAYENLTETIINKITAADATPPKQVYDQYQTIYEETPQTSSTTTTTTTTTRRSPLKTRGRPKYTTTPRNDHTDSSTRATVTRRPLRERRPLPPRSRYEPNKITTEKPTRKPSESGETTTKSSRTRTRGRVQYKPSESDENYNKRNRGGSKEEDLAYQRDVLHQNYPVTLMERMSTVDIEAMTEPTQIFPAGGESYDTEQAYAHESASSLNYPENTDTKEDVQYPSGLEYQTEATYASKPSTQSEEYFYQHKSSSSPAQSIYEDSLENQENKLKQTTTAQRPETVSLVTEPTSSTSDESQPNYSSSNEYSIAKQEESQTSQAVDITKVASQEVSHETKTEQNIVQTTPSYNRVRVRPGAIRQYHQSTSERSKPERRKPSAPAVTYRPAFDRRRTTMRIEEIEADLKTKQVHSRPEVQDYKHPVYKPDPTTEPTVNSGVDSSTKRGHFRRRRPSYTTTTTTTEVSSTRKSTYEVKNRFRGRRPTEKPTEKPEVQADTTSTTVRNTPFSRYSHRPRLSERYNRKPESEDSEDQDSNYSINRPKYAAPESEIWSPKISADTFKPYNPNDIAEDGKSITTEHKDDIDKDESDMDIITARNDYDDILISVTPATNNRGNKKLPEIPPTLEAFVDQSKTTKSDSTDTMSTFETMLEEVMKSLEEQDEDEYTNNVMKHKGGEIGEIPPERIISSGEEGTQKTTVVQEQVTTAAPIDDESTSLSKEQINGKRRRGYWKKVKVRPVSSEGIETAESQYYTSTVNRLGEAIGPSKLNHEKETKYDKPRVSVTTYKPTFEFIKDFFDAEDEIPEDVVPNFDIAKIDKPVDENQGDEMDSKDVEVKTEKSTSPGDYDLGTGSPDPTLMDSMYYSTPTEPTSSETVLSLLDRADGFSFMDYLFGVSDDAKHVEKKNETSATTKAAEVVITTEQAKSKATTTESTYIPEEITAMTDDNTEAVTEYSEVMKLASGDNDSVNEDNSPFVNIETSSHSSFMDVANVVSTSMSTEVSHETEICFRGKCIKTNKDLL